jgi:hypothetical protein
LLWHPADNLSRDWYGGDAQFPVESMNPGRPGTGGLRTSDIDRLQAMIDELRRQRNSCEPKNNQNPRYLRYSNAVSALLWIINDLQAENALQR